MDPWLQVVVGLAMLLVGAEVLVRGAVGLALRLSIPASIVGLTVVAIGTSVPELVISLNDTFGGSGAVAVGGVLGSNVFNIGAVLGLSALIYPVAIQSLTIKLEYPIMLATTLLFYWFARDGALSPTDGAVLLAVAVAFTVFLIVRVQVGARRRARQGEEMTETHITGTRGWAIILGLIGVGFTLVHLGGGLALEGAYSLAEQWGWSERKIGLTIVALGTSAPELAVSVVAAYKKQTEIAVGNIIGSCLFNLAFVLGLVATFGTVSIEESVRNWDIYWVMGLTVLMLPLMIVGRTLGRADGLLLTATFGVYYFLLLTR